MYHIRTIEMHLGGEPARIVVDGMPPVKGETMREKQEYIREHYDFIRTSLMLEPRGHKDMFGAILLPPCHPEADFGAVYMFGSNFEDLCGHATICICTMLIDQKRVAVHEPETVIHLDTPAGLVTVTAEVKNGKAQKISLRVVPGFVYERDLKIETPDYGIIQADIVYAGNAFIMIPAEKYGDIIPQNASRFASIGMEAVHALEGKYFLSHPELGNLRVATVNFYHEDRDIIIFGEGQVDRSPCGTGTASKVILLCDNGQLAAGTPYRNYGMLGTELTGIIESTTQVGRYHAYNSVIQGLGTVIGQSEFIIDESDPLYKGFILQ